jgi:hypothetical protein
MRLECVSSLPEGQTYTLRSRSKTKDEVLLTATAQNLRRLVKFLCRPPPIAAAACPA